MTHHDSWRDRWHRLLNWTEHHPWKTLGLFFCLFAIGKVVLSWKILFFSPLAETDEYLYLKMARSFFHGEGFQIHGLASSKYPPLYPVAISPAYLFEEMKNVAVGIFIINALLSSTIIFPAYFFARELVDHVKALAASVLVSLSVAGLCWYYRFRSENLFIPLLLLALFALYKGLFEDGYRWKVVAGLCVGLCFLTRYVAVVLFITVAATFFVSDYVVKMRNRSGTWKTSTKNWIENNMVVGLATTLVALPWLLRNASLFGYSLKGLVGQGYASEVEKIPSPDAGSGSPVIGLFESLSDFVIQVIIHNGFLVIASGIVFFVLTCYIVYRSFKSGDTKVFLGGVIAVLISEFLVALTAFHNKHLTWRLLDRYIHPAVPLLIIFGIAGLVKVAKGFNIGRKTLLLFGVLLIPQGFMLNSSSHSLVNFISSITHFSDEKTNLLLWVSGTLVLVIVSIVYIKLLKSRLNNSAKIITIIAAIMIVSTSIVFSVTSTERVIRLTSSPASELGKKIGEQVSGEDVVVFLDENLSNYKQGYSSLIHIIGSWINSPLRVDNVTKWDRYSDVEYVVSPEKLNLTVMYGENVQYTEDKTFFQGEEKNVKIYVYSVGGAVYE